jgi:serine/threonine-protein kinase
MNSEDTLMIDGLQQEPASGDVVQGYLLGDLLGRGANGAVYRATKPGEPGTYAVKIIDIRGQPQGFVDRILRECSISIRLRHPGIITVHEAGYWGPFVFIVMDVAEGHACDHYGKGALGWELATAVVRQVAIALDFAYATTHIIHRDIKPANIVVQFVGSELRAVKVVDFGLSRTVDDEGSGLTMTGMILGTPFFMSPEQARGERDLTFHTDLYALGATLFYLIAGRPPFHEGTPVEIRGAGPAHRGAELPTRPVGCGRPLLAQDPGRALRILWPVHRRTGSIRRRRSLRRRPGPEHDRSQFALYPPRPAG